MNEKQARRPPVAPKLSPTRLQKVLSQERDAQGAKRSIGGVNSTTVNNADAATSPPRNQVSSTSALIAATAAAGRSRSQTQQQEYIGARSSVSPIRGRSQISIDLRQAGGNPSQSHTTNDKPSLNRTTSAVAARIASASASPVRSSETSTSYGSPPGIHVIKIKSREDPGVFRDINGSEISNKIRVSNAADPGLKLSNGNAPTVPARNIGKLDFEQIPVLSGSASKPTTTLQNLRSSIPSNEATSTTHTISALPMPIPGSKSPPVGMSSTKSPPSAALGRTSMSASPKIHVTPPVTSRKDNGGFSRTTQPDQSLATRPLFARSVSPLHAKSPPKAQVSTQFTEPIDIRSRMTVNQLANAMVASSLASTRAPSRDHSPVKLKPPPVPRRRSRSLTELDAGLYDDVAKSKFPPVPSRSMKHTLRKQSPGHKDKDDDDAKRGRKHWVRKHPNKHHEGDRKRWRDKVTEHERKRYEGVWAANRGLLWNYEQAPFDARDSRKGTSEQDLVLNVVVRDIWNRSRLPRDVLEEIWDLVAPEGARGLAREEFVVGLWLIDQRLKGRKLPVKVSPSVWSSIRHTQGVKISNKPF